MKADKAPVAYHTIYSSISKMHSKINKQLYKWTIDGIKWEHVLGSYFKWLNLKDIFYCLDLWLLKNSFIPPNFKQAYQRDIAAFDEEMI